MTARTWRLLAYGLCEQGRYDEARMAAERGLRTPAEHTLGLASRKAKRFAEIVELLRRAIASSPERTSIREHLEEAEAKAGAAPG